MSKGYRVAAAVLTFRGCRAMTVLRKLRDR